MNEICNKCGLPKELCVCEDIAKESQKVTIKKEKRKFGKMYTIVEGIDPKEIDVKALVKKLKNKLSCGGSFKEGRIELQGDHMPKPGKPKDVRTVLVESGFAPETIIIK